VTEWMDRFDRWLTEEAPETGHSQEGSGATGGADIITPPITAEVETMLAGTFRPEDIRDPPEGHGQATQVPFLPRTFSSPRAVLAGGEEVTAEPEGSHQSAAGSGEQEVLGSKNGQEGHEKDNQVISEPRKPVRDPEPVSAGDSREELPERDPNTETPRTSRQSKFTMPEAWKSGATRDPPSDPGGNGVHRPRRRSPEERRRRNEQWQLYIRREHGYAAQDGSGTLEAREDEEVEGQPQGSVPGREVEFEKEWSSETVGGESSPPVIEVDSSPQTEESECHGFPSQGEEPPEESEP